MNRRAFLLGSAAALVPVPAGAKLIPYIAPSRPVVDLVAVLNAADLSFIRTMSDTMADLVIYGQSVTHFGADGVARRVPFHEWPANPGPGYIVERGAASSSLASELFQLLDDAASALSTAPIER